MLSSSEFKKKYDLQARKAEAERIRSKYPDRIPVICERAADAADEAHRSWARKEPFWDTHAAERRWAERGRKEGVEEASEGVQS